MIDRSLRSRPSDAREKTHSHSLVTGLNEPATVAVKTGDDWRRQAAAAAADQHKHLILLWMQHEDSQHTVNRYDKATAQRIRTQRKVYSIAKSSRTPQYAIAQTMLM